MNDHYLKINAFQLGVLASIIHEKRMTCYDDELMVQVMKDILCQIAMARVAMEADK